MKTVLIVVFFFTGFFVHAQDSKGIKFEQGLSWAQIKEKALKENRYIFVDGYTTWCAPCRFMAREVFPNPKVGEFFNKNFINVAVQFDETKTDNQEIKKWYKDARMLKASYKIESYPTYLFFTPEGKLVHTILGRSKNADEFIIKSQAALKPEMQYDKLKVQYDQGERSPEFLLGLIKAAQQGNVRKEMPVLINDYLRTQKDLLTEQNIGFILMATQKSTDPGFRILKNYKEKLDSVAGKGKTSEILKMIAFDEIVLPRLRIGGSKVDHGGGMVLYSGKLNENVNWSEIKAELNAEYPGLSEEIILYSKPTYFEWSKKWLEFTESVNEYLSKKTISDDLLNSYVWTVFTSTENPKSVEEAVKWSKKIFSNGNYQDPFYLYVYGNILYKAGKKEAAIARINEFAKNLESEDPRVNELLVKMKRGEKIW